MKGKYENKSLRNSTVYFGRDSPVKFTSKWLALVNMVMNIGLNIIWRNSILSKEALVHKEGFCSREVVS